MTLTPTIERLVTILHSGNHSLAVYNGITETFDGRGVSDLYRLLTQRPALMRGATIADKVVGKGAAALMILGEIKEVHADIISVPALELFKASPVTVTYDAVVPHIINRRGDGICPVEQLCATCSTPGECLPAISLFLDKHST